MLIYIVGAPRSGTTLLQQIVGNHPKIAALPHSMGDIMSEFDTHILRKVKRNTIIDNIPNIISGYMHTSDGISRVFDSPIAEGKSVKQYFESAFEVFQKRHNADAVLIKSPDELKNILKIKSLFPDIKIIHCVRDGRAVALSQTKRQYRNLYTAINQWKIDLLRFEVHKELIEASDCKVIKYEDLLQNPLEKINEIYDFLGFQKVDEIRIYNKSDSAEGKYVLDSIDPSKMNSWKGKISKNKIVKMEKIAGDVLSHYGYDLIFHANNDFKLLSLSKVWILNTLTSVRYLFVSERKIMKSNAIVTEHISFSKRLIEFYKRQQNDFKPVMFFKEIFNKANYS